MLKPLKNLDLVSRTGATVTLLSALLLSGCAINSSGPSGTTIAQVSGLIHGGQTAIQGATMKLYVTNSSATGYGQAATLIGSATSTAAGGFSISPSATALNCPAGQQAYVTGAGGYQTGQSTMTNASVLMMAALGDCSTISASTNVSMNEITTVAAAYALSGFMTTALNGNIYQANVSAPAANNAATGTATAAAGLPHAFLNAANLANYVSGTANTQTANITMAGATINGIVPAVEINTIADALQSCVDGPTGNSSCVTLFGYTPSISGTAPTNILQAAINLARNPYPSAAAMNLTTGILGLVTANSAFQPTLTAAPPDFSLAIVYKGGSFINPYDIALDANDTVYEGGSTVSTIAALSPYGVATPTFTAATGSGTRQIAPDALGNVWVTNNSTAVLQYSASSGGAAATTYTATGGDFWGVAVDKANNVWVANAVATTPNIVELAYATGTPATYTANDTATGPGGFEPVELTIDASQNIWASEYYTNATTAMVLPNLSAAKPASTPTYTASGTTVTPISTTFASSALKPLGVVIDASGNAWYGITSTISGTTVTSNTVTSTGLEEVIPTLTSSVITSLTSQSLIANATLGAKASQIPGIDGAGSIYLPDNQGAGALGIHVYSTTSPKVLSPPSGYLGCFLATSTTTACATGSSSAVYNPREISIDSTGSVWAGISTTGGLTQLIGLGAPTWPLLASGNPGLSPGLTAVNPLP